MRLLKSNLVIALATIFLLTLPMVASAQLILTGVFDGPLSGGTPKGVEVYVTDDIADLSAFGLGSANNGGGTDGEEFTFPADAAAAGTYLWVTVNEVEFEAFFGFAPTYVDGGYGMSINGDDALELFHNGMVIDTFGVIDVNGDDEPWDYTDSWAYRTFNTGPDGEVFVLENWTFGGPNTFDGMVTNDEADPSMPIGTFSMETVGTSSLSFDSVKALFNN